MSRQNNICKAGWHTVMDGLQIVTSIGSFNCVEGLWELFAGTAVEVDLSSKKLREREATTAISLLLPRSDKILTTLDLRYCS